MKNILLYVFCIVLTFNVRAQISQGGKPNSLNLQLDKNVPTFTLPPLDMEKVNAEDQANKDNSKIIRTGIVRPVNLTLQNSGVWTTLDNGDRIWRLVIDAQGATYTTLLYENFELPQGAKLYLYQPDYSQIIGSFTKDNNHESGQFTTELIYGSKSVIEYYEPVSVKGNGNFTISGVIHLYKRTPWETAIVQGFDDSETCEININCSEGNNWQDEKKGVARILVVNGTSQGWCSGTLVNNTALDCKPYFLTAFHCGETATTANFNNWTFYFNYEASGCTSPNSENTILNSPNYFTVNGASVKASSNNGGSSSSDLLLLEFNSNIPQNYDVYYNGWNRVNSASTSGVGIHHPAGDIKKISTYTQTLQTTGWNGSGLSSHWQVYWASTTNGQGVTEGGSSGSPLFNNQGLVIGTLTGGGSYCATPNRSDSYGKMSYHWNTNGTANNRRIDVWLDPIGNGTATTLNGTYAPCSPSVARDAGITLINNPGAEICGTTFIPEVVLRNFGSSNLTSCQIKFGLVAGTIQTYNWTGNLATNGTATVTLPQVTTSITGNLTFTAYTELPNGNTDQNTSNDAQSLSVSIGASATLPLTQGFQNVTFPPLDYEISNADNDETWQRTNSFGSGSSASMYIDNWNYNGNGAYDWFILPAVSFTGVTSATLSYDYAYAYYDGQQGVSYDSLIVAFSTDCGSSWYALTRDGGASLATVGGRASFFEPTSTEWENEVVDLNIPQLNNQSGVQFAFVAVNGYGNNLYIDNINLQAASSVLVPVANFTASRTTICVGESITFTNTSTNNPTAFSWNFTGGTPATSNQENPTITFNTPGVYTVSLNAANTAGNDTETKTSLIVVNENPSITISTVDVNCNDGSASVFVNGGQAPYVFSWSNSTSTTEIANNLVQGSFDVTVTDANNCSVTQSGVISSAPNALSVVLDVVDNSTINGNSRISGIVQGGNPPYTYLWSNGDTTTMIDNLITGYYTLTVTDSLGCQATETASIGNVAINNNVNWLSSINLFPNPTNGVLNLALSLKRKQDLNIQIINTLGQVIQQKNLNDFDEGITVFNMNNQAKGVYFIRVSNNRKSEIIRFIKK